MTKRGETGKKGEKYAEEFLVKNSFNILAKNYRFQKSEIDIICIQNDTLIFVEVKTRADTTFGNPEDFVTDHQIEKIHEGAQAYQIDNNWNGPIRFDIISIILNNDEIVEIEHFKDAF